jgi:hypothetical protein
MATQSNKKYKSYMKPAATRVTIQKPQQKGKVKATDILPGGFSRISDSKIRKVYK